MSRGAYKSKPYNNIRSNFAFNNKQLAGINKFCGTSFTLGDMELIYTNLGNGCNADLCERFIRSGYDLGILTAHRKQKEVRIDG